MGDHEQTPPARMPDSDVTTLIHRVIRVGDCNAKVIAKYRNSFEERNLMLADVFCRLARIPFELHSFSVAIYRRWSPSAESSSVLLSVMVTVMDLDIDKEPIGSYWNLNIPHDKTADRR